MTESKEVATRDETSKAVAATDPLGNVGALLDQMMHLAKDPSVDAAKFETIARVVKDTRDDAKREQFYQDKAAAMFDLPVIRKDSKIIIPGKNGAPDRVQGTFAKWPDMQRAINPVLDAHNLRLSHDIGHEGTIVLVTPILQHRNGYVERGGQMALPLDTSGGKNNTQGAGSAQSYGMRYTSVAMLGIRYDAADDDGNLIALPDEPLNDQQQQREREAEAAFAQGREAYEEWFTSIPAIDRAWFIQTGRHEKYGGKALPGAQKAQEREKPAGRPDAPPAQEKAPDAAQGEAQPKKNKKMTPEQWVAGYEKDCKNAKSLDDLATIQDAGKKAKDALKQQDPTLHDRCVRAGGEAYDRLCGKGGSD